MPDGKHAVLSPSSSHIWLNCTPAARFAEKFPDGGSVYAAQGTEAHALAEHKLKAALGIETTDPRAGMEHLDEEMEECTDDYVSYVLETMSRIRDEHGKPDIYIEQKVDFSRWVPEGFGYADCIIVSEGTVSVIDLKYGTGVEVDAEWNPQFLLYALGTVDFLDFICSVREVTVTAFQPRLKGVSSFTLTKDELLDWAEETLRPKAELAFSGGGEFNAGEHCRFCRAKTCCRKRAERNLELARYDFAPPEELSNLEIASILAKADELASWVKDISQYALEKAIEGERFEGWKLVAGRSVRKYTDEDKVAEAAVAAGFDPYERSVLGITAMEKLMGKKRFGEVLGSLVVKPKGKPTLVPESDKRPAVDTAAEDFKKEDKQNLKEKSK